MTVTRLMIFILLALVPLAGLRELWWSEVLFAKPWEKAGGGEADFGAAAGLLGGPFAALLTILIGLFAGLVIDILGGYLQRMTLPVLGIVAALLSICLVFFISDLSWNALWPLFGFSLAALYWSVGVLELSKKI